MIKIAFLNTNREPYPLPDNLINGGLWITGKLVVTFSKTKDCQVFFFTSEDSIVPENVQKITLGKNSFYKQIGSRDILPSEVSAAIFFEQALIGEAIKMANKHCFDLIHIHSNFFYIGNFLEFFPIPIVYTLHDPITLHHRLLLKNHKIENLHLVAVSHYQKTEAEGFEIPIFGTVYNGIDIENFSFSQEGGEHLLFLGRMVLKKGIEEAIQAAKTTKKRLVLVGDYRKYDKAQIQEKVLIKVDNKSIVWKKPKDRTEAIKHYSQARAVLAPILWEEPFGLVAVESMASGTPVIGYARGAFPEIIKDGETGFLVNPSDKDIRGSWIVKKSGQAGLNEAVERIYALQKEQYQKMRKKCRLEVEKKYTTRQMTNNYRALYNKIVL